MTNTITILLAAIWIAVMVVIFNLGRIAKVFNLTDRRPLISCSEAYTKFNTLVEQANVSLYTFEAYDESTSINLSVEFKRDGGTIKGAFSGKDMGSVINQAYDWSVEEGFIE
jgi:hypothetical protein